MVRIPPANSVCGASPTAPHSPGAGWNRPAQTAVAAQTVLTMPDHHRSCVYGPYSGPPAARRAGRIPYPARTHLPPDRRPRGDTGRLCNGGQHAMSAKVTALPSARTGHLLTLSEVLEELEVPKSTFFRWK